MGELEWYAGLLEERTHVDAFLRAIAKTVRRGDHVVEIGCGLGTYALAAQQAGAARVTAIDSSALAIAMARELGVARAGVRLVESNALDVTLQRRADVVIFEDYGGFGHSAGYVRLLKHARAKLARKGARWIARRVELWLAPVDVRPAMRTRRLPFSAEAVALLRRRAMSEAVPKDVPAARQIAPGVRVARLDPSGAWPIEARYRATARATRAAKVTGLAGWIRLDLGGGIVIDNAPAVRGHVWTHRFFPFVEPLEVRRGERLSMSVEVSKGLATVDPIYRWSVAGRAGRREGCNVNAMPGDVEWLRRCSPEWVPRAGSKVRLARALLAALDGKNSVRAIAETVYSEKVQAGPDRDRLLEMAFRLAGEWAE